MPSSGPEFSPGPEASSQVPSVEQSPMSISDILADFELFTGHKLKKLAQFGQICFMTSPFQHKMKHFFFYIINPFQINFTELDLHWPHTFLYDFNNFHGHETHTSLHKGPAIIQGLGGNKGRGVIGLLFTHLTTRDVGGLTLHYLNAQFWIILLEPQFHKIWSTVGLYVDMLISSLMKS